jgi:hypothetical protein
MASATGAGAGGAEKAMDGGASAARSASACFIAATWAGVVPQQPPIRRTPASTKRRAYSAKYSGVEK